jgi:hypothetical protein
MALPEGIALTPEKGKSFLAPNVSNAKHCILMINRTFPDHIPFLIWTLTS